MDDLSADRLLEEVHKLIREDEQRGVGRPRHHGEFDNISAEQLCAGLLGDMAAASKGKGAPAKNGTQTGKVDDRLYNAVKKLDLETVRDLIHERVDPHVAVNGDTPLQLARMMQKELYAPRGTVAMRETIAHIVERLERYEAVYDGLHKGVSAARRMRLF